MKKKGGGWVGNIGGLHKTGRSWNPSATYGAGNNLNALFRTSVTSQKHSDHGFNWFDVANASNDKQTQTNLEGSNIYC